MVVQCRCVASWSRSVQLYRHVACIYDKSGHLTSMVLQVQSAVDGTMPLVNRCIFSDNHAQRYGGAILVKSVTGEMIIQNSIFDGNTACVGGAAAAFLSTGSVQVHNCTFGFNYAVLQGCSRDDRQAWSMGEGGAIMHVR
jgi:Chlamydia polymorphic membrane protein (Chlamydia_PMP) repeat